MLEHPVALVGADLGTLDVARIGRVPVGDIAEPVLHDRDALVVARAWEQHPGQHDTALAPMDAHGPGHGELGLEVGVVEHDVRRLAAQLEEEPLERRGALLHDPAPHGRRTGERDQVDPGIGDEVLGHRLSEVVTTWKTPAGKSVRSAANRPMRVAFQGVLGAALRITVLPVASA